VALGLASFHLVPLCNCQLYRVLSESEIINARTKHPERKPTRICVRGLSSFAHFYPQQWFFVSCGFVLVQVQVQVLNRGNVYAILTTPISVVGDLCFDACFSQLEPKPPSGGQEMYMQSSQQAIYRWESVATGNFIDPHLHYNPPPHS
jgi:hypothetical protein